MVRGNRGRGGGSFAGRGRPPMGRGGASGNADDDAASTDGAASEDAAGADAKAKKKGWRRKKAKGKAPKEAVWSGYTMLLTVESV